MGTTAAAQLELKGTAISGERAELTGAELTCFFTNKAIVRVQYHGHGGTPGLDEMAPFAALPPFWVM